MDDLISRQAAISEIMEDLEDRSLHDDPATPEDFAEGYDEGIRNAAAIVLQMPSTQQTGTKTVQVDDCISREAALTALERDEEYDKDIPNRADGVRDAIITISALPSTQPGWIPVTERLPEYGTTVLTCDHDGEYEINHIIDEEDGEWFLNGAVAWIPIPKPWEGDANG